MKALSLSPILLSLCLIACGDGSYKIKTASSHPAETSNDEGFAIGGSAQSADGSTTVVANGNGTSTESNFTTKTSTAAVSTFCLDDITLAGGLVSISDSNGALLQIENSGCASAQLDPGSYRLAVVQSSEDAREPAVMEYPGEDGGFLMLISLR